MMRRAALLFVAAVATLSASSAHATIVISSDRGGLISDYAARFLSARDSGEQVVIDGACLSACTLVVGMVPRGKVCATPKAVLGFHSAWRPMAGGTRVNSTVATQAMLDVYPADLRKWIAQRGGLSSKMIFLYGRELAEIVPPCASSVIASLSGGAKTPHQPHVVKRDTTRAALVARQGREQSPRRRCPPWQPRLASGEAC